MKWCGTGMKWLEWSDMMEQSEVSQCGLRMKNWNEWKWKVDALEWGNVETNKSQVKYEANVSELACDELNLALLSANLKTYLLLQIWYLLLTYVTVP